MIQSCGFGTTPNVYCAGGWGRCCGRSSSGSFLLLQEPSAWLSHPKLEMLKLRLGCCHLVLKQVSCGDVFPYQEMEKMVKLSVLPVLGQAGSTLLDGEVFETKRELECVVPSPRQCLLRHCWLMCGIKTRPLWCSSLKFCHLSVYPLKVRSLKIKVNPFWNHSDSLHWAEKQENRNFEVLASAPTSGFLFLAFKSRHNFLCPVIIPAILNL